MNIFTKLVVSNSLVRYVLIGGISFLIELTLLLTFINIGLGSAIAVSISFWIGLAIAFVLQKLFAFKNAERRPKHIVWQTVTYAALVLFNYLFTLTFVVLMDSFLGVVISRTVALGITITWNYLLYRHVIFNEQAAVRAKSLLSSRRTSWHKTLITAGLITPILVFVSPMFAAGLNTILYGDYDMQVQMTEAARKSISEYGQFPFWNPWVSGGVPLFADPQFGLITPQTFLALASGSSALAWKLTISLYFIIGFLSMFKLLSYMTDMGRVSVINNILLAYTWIFGSFFALRSTGHFTFMLLTLTPLAIYFYLKLAQGRRYTIYLILLVAYLFNAALHYSSILILLILLALMTLDILWQLYRNRGADMKSLILKSFIQSDSFKRGRNLILAITAGLVLVLPRIYFSLEYLRDNSVDRSTVMEPFVGLEFGLNAIMKPLGSYVTPHQVLFSDFEASSFIGPVVLLLFVLSLLSLVASLIMKRTSLGDKRVRLALAFVLIATLAFIVGLAGKPFELLRELPVMSSMRVSTRYFFITSFGIIVATSLLLSLARSAAWVKDRFLTPFVTTILACSTLYVAYIDFTTYMQPNWRPNPSLIRLSDVPNASTVNPRSEALWGYQEPHYYALTQATQNHRSQLIADNALVDTRAVPTSRCDEDDKERECSFVLTKNAYLISWSPNQFVLKRTGEGPIRLNINQASHWSVNGLYVSPTQKTVESASIFTINDTYQKMYVVSYRPLPGLLK